MNAVFNPGGAQFDGETLLLVRVEDRTGISHLGVARSADGLTDWVVDPDRSILPDLESEAERFGIEDPRITGCDDEYLIVYTGYSRGPARVPRDHARLPSYERRGVIMPPEDKDAALFPRRFGGRWGLIHRPVAATPRREAHMWLRGAPISGIGTTTSPAPCPRRRLVGREQDRSLDAAAQPRKAGSSSTTASADGRRLDLSDRPRPPRPEQPERVLARSSEWMFGPGRPYERTGDVDQVVFPCGWLLAEDGDTLRIYYGAADTSVCVATASLRTPRLALPPLRAEGVGVRATRTADTAPDVRREPLGGVLPK